MNLLVRLRWVITGLLLGAFAQPLAAQVTESPETVAPGRFLVEMDGLTLAMGRAEEARNTYTATAIASTLVSTGLTSSVDIQVGFDLFYRYKLKYQGGSDSTSGLGDLSFRTKWTFWRNAEWGAAAAIIPYVKLPTSRDGLGTDAVEGGIIVPWAMDLGAGVTAGAMASWDLVRNDADNGYDSHWLTSAYIGRPLPFGITLYGEALLEANSAKFSDWAGQIGGGALWQWSEQLQFDYQLLRGLNSRASDWTHVFRVNWGW
ncbi:transporter [Opitutus terrae]|uniref:Transporter n=1 Tax=Opitutus terrae (strain DSM 11246 / JCM 15787 / PB90-1) TaxID=452637 RepID=B1ZWB3_OPITP|nr:transporter [Opitutus terrae]ACB76865.1 hypothetical protein Oter_3588 [Opitutus terrae PB90-1]